MSEYSIDLCQQGVSTLWGSFEVQNVRLVRMMLKQFSLVDLDSSLQEFDKVAERFSQLPMYFTRFHGTNEVEKVLEILQLLPRVRPSSAISVASAETVSREGEREGRVKSCVCR